MNKDNIFKSSQFYMSEGDVLHLLFLDESGTPVTVTLNSLNDDADIPEAPTALAASDITPSGFVANWYLNENSLGYYLDVATDSAFTSMVAGYDNLDVGDVNEYPVTGLSMGATYYYRVRAYNDNGTSTNSNTESATMEIEDVVIGVQTWMTANISDNIVGSRVYADNEANRSIYGGLYTWEMVSAIEALYPGWHVPTRAEWLTLIANQGGVLIAGKHLKEAGNDHWFPDLSIGDNASGFTGRGAGAYYAGAYQLLTTDTFWWTKTASADPTRYYAYQVDSTTDCVYVNMEDNTVYFSVRLIKD